MILKPKKGKVEKWITKTTLALKAKEELKQNKFIVIVLILGCLMFFDLEVKAQSWFLMPDFPGLERDDGAGFVIGDQAYCGSGVVPFVALGDFYAFDLNAESWDTIAALPAGQERQYSNGFASDSFGFLFGGNRNGVFLNDLWRYDPRNDQWQSMADLPAEGRGGASSFVIDSLAYIIGGKTDSLDAVAEVWTYNLHTDIWQQKSDLPFGSRWRASASSSLTKGYLAFGLDDSLHYHDELYEYSAALDQWTKLSDFPFGGRNYVKMHLLGSKLICIGGYDSAARFLNEVWSFDIGNSSWDSLVSIPAAGRRGGISFQSANAIYYTTGLGDNGVRFKESWKLEDPTTIDEIKAQGTIKLYPNPGNDHIFLILSTENARLFKRYRIYDLNGRVIKAGKLQAHQKLDLSKLKQGVYILDLGDDQEHLCRKIIKR